MTSTSYRLTIAIFNLWVTCVTVSVLKNKILNYCCGRREFQIHRGISQADLARLKCHVAKYLQVYKSFAMPKKQPQQDTFFHLDNHYWSQWYISWVSNRMWNSGQVQGQIWSSTKVSISWKVELDVWPSDLTLNLTAISHAVWDSTYILLKSWFSNHHICVRKKPSAHKPKVTVFLSIPRYYNRADLQA